MGGSRSVAVKVWQTILLRGFYGQGRNASEQESFRVFRPLRIREASVSLSLAFGGDNRGSTPTAAYRTFQVEDQAPAARVRWLNPMMNASGRGVGILWGYAWQTIRPAASGNNIMEEAIAQESGTASCAFLDEHHCFIPTGELSPISSVYRQKLACTCGRPVIM